MKQLTEPQYMGLLLISDTLSDLLQNGKRCWEANAQPLSDEQKKVCEWDIKKLNKIMCEIGGL